MVVAVTLMTLACAVLPEAVIGVTENDWPLGALTSIIELESKLLPLIVISWGESDWLTITGSIEPIVGALIVVDRSRIVALNDRKLPRVSCPE